jgi:tagatose 1,6-diphosphate aldolase
MDVRVSEGKWRRLRSLADREGRFKMMAIDQRGSMVDAIAKVTNRGKEQVSADELATAKEVITRVLAPYATAVLTDPIYGYPYSYQSMPPGIGLLLAHEETGYERSGPTGKERKTTLIEGWSVEKAEHAGADAVKLLLYYHPDASEEVRRHQQDLVQRLGEACGQASMPFLLELVAYALEEASTNTDEYARKKPDLVIRSAREFSASKYGVDVLKLEFPADLKRTKEFCGGAFDSQERQAVYQLRMSASLPTARSSGHALGDPERRREHRRVPGPGGAGHRSRRQRVPLRSGHLERRHGLLSRCRGDGGVSAR